MRGFAAQPPPRRPPPPPGGPGAPPSLARAGPPLLAGRPPASAPAAPAVLPAVTRALHAAAPTGAGAPACTALPAGGPGTATAPHRAPMSGYLSVRRAGASGDWDLLLRDASSGRRLGGSQGFGGHELVQTWIGA